MGCTRRKKNKIIARKKRTRKIHNWKKYNNGLKSRGNINIWINPEVLKGWHYSGPRGHGGHYIYSDHTILTCLTDHLTSDVSQVITLRYQIKPEIDDFIADGAYDSKSLFKDLLDKNKHSPGLIVPPVKGAVRSTAPEFKQRNDHLSFIEEHGRDQWEIESGYTMQSKAENNFFRYKTIIGRKLASRLPKNQKTEASLGCLILNKMTLCGMPNYGER